MVNRASPFRMTNLLHGVVEVLADAALRCQHTLWRKSRLEAKSPALSMTPKAIWPAPP
jgi:hypothetical protein